MATMLEWLSKSTYDLRANAWGRELFVMFGLELGFAAFAALSQVHKLRFAFW